MIKNASRYDETHLKLMRLVLATPAIVQRDLAKALGMSLGRTNFCIKTLVTQGLLKIENVRSSDNKRGSRLLLSISDRCCTDMPAMPETFSRVK